MNRCFREERSNNYHSTSASLTQHLSRTYVTYFLDIGIMMNLLFLLGVVILVKMTTSTTPLIVVASVASIQLEGNAMADIARAIPGLTTLIGMNRFYVHIVCLTHVF